MPTLKNMRVLRTTPFLITVCSLGVVQSTFAGTIVGWCYSEYDQASPPDGNDFSAIAAGFYHSLALKSDGSIVGWGISDGWIYDDGQVTDTPDDNDFVALAAGSRHSLALRSDGSIVGWGAGIEGLGFPPNCGQATPPEGNDFVTIAAGGYHSLAIREAPGKYSCSTVNGTSSHVGGLVGNNRGGSIISSFWNIETSGQAASAGDIGKTTAEMQTASTFLKAGWDFVDETTNGNEDIWWILEGRDYPRLWWGDSS